MKTIPFVPACQNMEEIQKLAVLITDFIHPEMIVLFGRYAGMPSYDIRGGYELLILTANQPAVGVKEVMGYLAMNFPEKDRKEPYLSLHLLTVVFVHHHSSQSHFLYTIRKEGVLLYKNESCKLKDKVCYKPVRSYRQAEGYSDQCLALGRAFLQDARRQQQSGIPRMSAFYPVFSGSRVRPLRFYPGTEGRFAHDLSPHTALFGWNGGFVERGERAFGMEAVRSVAVVQL